MVVLYELAGGHFTNQAMSASVIYDLFMQTDNLPEQLANVVLYGREFRKSSILVSLEPFVCLCKLKSGNI